MPNFREGWCYDQGRLFCLFSLLLFVNGLCVGTGVCLSSFFLSLPASSAVFHLPPSDWAVFITESD